MSLDRFSLPADGYMAMLEAKNAKKLAHQQEAVDAMMKRRKEYLQELFAEEQLLMRQETCGCFIKCSHREGHLYRPN